MRPNGLPPTHSEGRGGEQGKTAHPNTHRHVATRPQGPEQAALLKRLGGGAGSGSRRLGPSLLAPVWERPTDTLLLGPEGGQGSRRSSGKRPAAWSQGGCGASSFHAAVQHGAGSKQQCRGWMPQCLVGLVSGGRRVSSLQWWKIGRIRLPCPRDLSVEMLFHMQLHPALITGGGLHS